MSVKHGLLALLTLRPAYGAQLRAEFEDRTAGSWPLNVGQVYTTLGRLERDGLVAPEGGPDAEGRIRYRITAAGEAEVEGWWSDAVSRDVTPRDELAIKIALAVTVPGVDVTALVQTQRTATLDQIRTLTRRKRTLTAEEDDDPERRRDTLARLLVVENLIFAAEAESRWLDHVEERLRPQRGA